MEQAFLLQRPWLYWKVHKSKSLRLDLIPSQKGFGGWIPRALRSSPCPVIIQKWNEMSVSLLATIATKHQFSLTGGP